MSTDPSITPQQQAVDSAWIQLLRKHGPSAVFIVGSTAAVWTGVTNGIMWTGSNVILPVMQQQQKIIDRQMLVLDKVEQSLSAMAIDSRVNSQKLDMLLDLKTKEQTRQRQPEPRTTELLTPPM